MSWVLVLLLNLLVMDTRLLPIETVKLCFKHIVRNVLCTSVEFKSSESLQIFVRFCEPFFELWKLVHSILDLSSDSVTHLTRYYFSLLFK